MIDTSQMESNLEEEPSNQSMIDMLQKMMSGNMMPCDMMPRDMMSGEIMTPVEEMDSELILNSISDTTNLIYDEVCAITISNDMSKDIAESINSKLDMLADKIEKLSNKVDKLMGSSVDAVDTTVDVVNTVETGCAVETVGTVGVVETVGAVGVVNATVDAVDTTV